MCSGAFLPMIVQKKKRRKSRENAGIFLTRFPKMYKKKKENKTKLADGSAPRRQYMALNCAPVGSAIVKAHAIVGHAGLGGHTCLLELMTKAFSGYCQNTSSWFRLRS